MKALKGIAVGVLGMGLAGCSAGPLSQVSNAYGAVRAGMTAKSAAASVKDIRQADAVFAGYTAVTAIAEVSPRQDLAGFPETFRQNMLYLVRETGRATNAPFVVCAVTVPQQCGGRVLVVQFQEEAFGASAVERYTMGDRLKGTLTFVDLASGTILSSKRVEGAQDYSGLMGLIQGSITLSVVRSYPSVDPATSKQRGEALSRIKAVQPGFETAFKRS